MLGSKLFDIPSYHRRKSTKFLVNPMKDVGGFAEIRSLGRTAGWTEGLTEGRME